mgnify:FL=1
MNDEDVRKINAERVLGQFRKYALNAGDESGSVLDYGEYGVNVYDGNKAKVVVNEARRKNMKAGPEQEEQSTE